VKEEIFSKTPILEFNMIALAGGFPDDIVPVEEYERIEDVPGVNV